MNLNHASKATIALNAECSAECRSNLLKVALSMSQSPTQDRCKIVEKISNDYKISRDQIIELVSLYLAIIQLFVDTTDTEFHTKLVDLGFTNEFIEELPLVSNRSKVIDTILNSRRRDFNKLVSLKWRIDISLTNSSLTKKIPTTVILCLQLKNGHKYTINVNIITFHKLRFNVASIMKEIAGLKINQLSK